MFELESTSDISQKRDLSSSKNQLFEIFEKCEPTFFSGFLGVISPGYAISNSIIWKENRLKFQKVKSELF